MNADPVMYLSARGSYAGETRGAVHDFRDSLRESRVWRVLAVNDILARYRGSLLGPFWITLTIGAFILGIGLLYSQLFKIETRVYIPLLATGVILWQLWANILSEGCSAFIESHGIIKQTSVPLPTFLWRVIFRNIIIFLHQAVVLVILGVFFGYLLQIQIGWALIGLVLSIVNVGWMALVCAIVCTRFRDVPQVVQSLIQMLFFLTPVLWDPKQAGGRAQVVLSLNPFYHMLEVIRPPLLGHAPQFGSFGVLLVLAVVGWIGAFLFFSAVRRRVVHYL